MITKEQVLSKIKELKPELESQYNVKSIGLFGSLLHGEFGRESDIDLLVEFRSPIGFFHFLNLEEYLSKKLQRKVDLVSKKALKPAIGRVILSEVVMV